MSSHTGSVVLSPGLALWASVSVYGGMVTLEVHVALSFSSSGLIKTRQCFLDGSKVNVKVKLGLFSLRQPEKSYPPQH